ncbi:MAG: peptidase M28, partial [Gemmatimonadaceae bacterium]
MHSINRGRFVALIVLGATLGCSRTAVVTSAPATGFPGLDAIRGDDLRRDLFTLAGDAMRGREAGTLDELRASGWIVEQIRSIGLEPAGEDGTYYQWWPMRRIRLSDASTVRIDGAPLELGKDVIVPSAHDATLDLPIVYVGTGSDTELQGMDLTAKAVAATLVAPPNPPGREMSLAGWRYVGAAVRAQSARLVGRGAAAVVLITDSLAESAFDFYAATSGRGTYGLDTAGGPRRPRSQPPIVLVRQSVAAHVRAPGARLAATLMSESFVYPSVNIVGRVRGTDAVRREEYVLFSG